MRTAATGYVLGLRAELADAESRLQTKRGTTYCALHH